MLVSLMDKQERANQLKQLNKDYKAGYLTEDEYNRKIAEKYPIDKDVVENYHYRVDNKKTMDVTFYYTAEEMVEDGFDNSIIQNIREGQIKHYKQYEIEHSEWDSDLIKSVQSGVVRGLPLDEAKRTVIKEVM